MKVQVNTVQSNIQQLHNDFMEGNNFDMKLSDIVLGSIDRVDGSSYEDVLASVKQVMNQSSKYEFENLFMVFTDTELTEKQKAVLIRYVNLCHRGRNYFVMVNYNLIYIPVKYARAEIASIEAYVDALLKKIAYIQKCSKLKKGVGDFFSSFSFRNLFPKKKLIVSSDNPLTMAG